METKPCPFCCNPKLPENDSGGACCFCDYQGSVSIGRYGNFSTLSQYNKVFNSTNHQEAVDRLHGRTEKSSYDISLKL